MRPLDDASLVKGGLPGDRHFSKQSQRQLLLIENETLARLGLTPGQVKENLTMQGIDLGGFLAGSRLRVGDAEIEITRVGEPCSRMEEIRPGLQRELIGRRGLYAVVVLPGRVWRGAQIDEIQPNR